MYKEVYMKIHFSKFLLAAALSAAVIGISGCGGNTSSSSNGIQYTYKDQSITVAAKPQRVIELSAPLLNMAYAVGGTSIARPNTTSEIPEAAQNLPEIGRVSHINMEQLVGLSPDLVIGEKTQNSKIADQLKSNHIPYILINYDGLNDNIDVLKFLGKIYGTEEKTDKLIADYQSKMDELEKKSQAAASSHPVKVAVLRATGKDVTVETPKSICASMTLLLHMNNVVMEHSNAANTDAKTIPYSLEQLSADNPDIIFIVTMGKPDEINASLNKSMRDNPAWSSLQAVQNNKVYTLDSQDYLMNPGIHTPEAMEHLYKLAYEN